MGSIMNIHLKAFITIGAPGTQLWHAVRVMGACWNWYFYDDADGTTGKGKKGGTGRRRTHKVMFINR